MDASSKPSLNSTVPPTGGVVVSAMATIEVSACPLPLAITRYTPPVGPAV